MLLGAGLVREAQEELENAAVSRPDAEIPDGLALALGSALAEAGDASAAARVFEMAAARESDPVAHDERQLALAVLEAAGGDRTGAARRLAKLERFSDSEGIRDRATSALAAIRRLDEEPRWAAVLGGACSTVLPGAGQAL
ncbi:MAG: hypothetical protein AAB368_12455, partial [bacterium]